MGNSPSLPDIAANATIRHMLNRSSLVIRPLQPYLEWAQSHNDSAPLQDYEVEPTVYLIPEVGSERDEHEVLLKVYPEVFEMELFEWHTDRTAWPKDRSLAVFMKWFKFEIHSIVQDLCSYPLEDDEADA